MTLEKLQRIYKITISGKFYGKFEYQNLDSINSYKTNRHATQITVRSMVRRLNFFWRHKKINFVCLFICYYSNSF